MTSGGLLPQESRIVAESLLQDLSLAEWRDYIEKQNPLQKKSPQTAMRYAHTIRRRLQPLGQDYIKDVSSAGGQVYIQLLLLAAVLHTPVIADFMSSVIRDTRRQYKRELAVTAWDDFINDKARVIDGLGSFTDATIHKTGTNLMRILAEAGYLDSARNKVLLPVYLLPETQQWLERLDRNDLTATLECTL